MNTMVSTLKDVGPKRTEQLYKLKIYSVQDLLYHLPRQYADMSTVIPAHLVQDGQETSLMGTVTDIRSSRKTPRLTLTEVMVDDGFKGFRAVFFNQTFIKKEFAAGARVLFYGKISIFHNRVSINVTEYEDITGTPESDIPKLLPLYPLTSGITQRWMRNLIKAVLEEYEGQVDENIPVTILNKRNLPDRYTALKMAHFPRSLEEVELSRKRLAFEELFYMQLVLANRKRDALHSRKEHAYHNDGRLITRYYKSLPYKLTAGQLKAWKEILEDMNSNRPMARLLQGDVGSGKTTVCTLAALKATEAGYQAAIMAPTEILAIQHYKKLNDNLKPFGVKVALLTSSHRDNIKEADIIIGTHALVQEKVEFNNLGLVVIDEHHRFGVNQRSALMAKTRKPDLLVMTATPIPRTMAMVTYGHMDLSLIDTMPAGRLPVVTTKTGHKNADIIWQKLKNQLNQDRQAYVVCALVEESEKVEQQAATELHAKLKKVLGDYRVGLLHGRMKPQDKEAVMAEFARGETDILISTTVIEVGVDVPNATVMVILDADRFGLAQLHQLRGRVGRGQHQSYCLLVADPKTDEGRARLEVMCQTNDGFKLAEEDLKIRGPGEFFGTRQSGESDFKVADLVRDQALLMAARKDAFYIIMDDPGLILPENQVIYASLENKNRQYEQVSV